MAKREWLCRLVGSASGLLLAIPHFYPALAPLQTVALTPILYFGISRKVRHRDMLLAGFYMGLAYTLPQMIVLQLPILMTLILTTHLTIVMVVFAWGSAQLFGGPAIWGSFAIGAFLVVLDWANFTVVPIWGTAQSLVRPWSRYPTIISFVSLTGITGIIFALGTLQALAVNFIIHPKLRIRLLAAAVAVVFVFLAANIVVWYQRPTGKLKVAAIGWISNDSARLGETYCPEGFDALFAQPVAQAANQGAKLIVSPEIGFYTGRYKRKELFERFAEIARSYNVFLAIGYFNDIENENRLVFISPQGKVLSEYTKTHLTAFEKYRKGNGTLRTIDIEGIQVGSMICQDDNFTNLSREYGRKPVAVVAVPMLDWLQVKNAHLQNSIHRAIESRYGIVRAAFDGISAIVSPTGEVLAYKDHFKDGPGAIVAEMSVYTHRTLFSILGHWPVVPSILFLATYVVWNLARSRFRNRIKGRCPEGKDK